MSESGSRGGAVRLPGDVTRPFEVYVNAILQVEGRDYVVRDGVLRFERPLAREKVGAARWTRMFLGIAGSYGANDDVDVLYTVGGEKRVAAKLPLL
ncbi:MAG: hypothetical protein EXQ77_05340 [Thermoleophilia bacterium]|nr:hypothetical protein [Thermoleophilia bacterium]